MVGIEQALLHFLLTFFSVEQVNAALGDPRTVAILIGSLVALSGGLLGTFLLLRKLSLTTDAISHTVLLGIVVAFLVMVGVFGLEPDLSSPLLILGAAAAGVLTVALTETIQRSGLVKGDAALGLIFSALFAVAVILVSRFTANIHLDTDSVLVGEIGIAWANSRTTCLENCESVTITLDDPRAKTARQCVNCAADNISPRSPQAVFEDICSNCGTYTAAEAWSAGLTDQQPVLVFLPKSLLVMGAITLLNLLFVTLLYKELKLATFDEALAKSLGFRPVILYYALMILVSVTVVGAFDAVGAVLVVAFFIIPPATAYLLTDRLSLIVLLSPLFGVVGAVTGYDLASGRFLGVLPISDLLVTLDRLVGLGGYTTWNVSISASMVIMTFLIFLLVWVISPRQGIIVGWLRRRQQREQFADQLVLGHLYNHREKPEAAVELAAATLHEHLDWTPERMAGELRRLRLLGLVQVAGGQVELTPRGVQSVEGFMASTFGAG